MPRTQKSYSEVGLKGAIARWGASTFQDRFWSKVEKRTGCWHWTGSINPITGYGKLRAFGGWTSAHRLAWFFANGVIPRGKCVLHKCDNRSCCNPEHLFVGTKKDNILDAIKKGRADARWKSKIKQSDIEMIRQLSNKHTQGHIASRFGISQGHVSRILSGKRHFQNSQ